MTNINIPTETGYYWVRVSYTHTPDEFLIVEVIRGLQGMLIFWRGKLQSLSYGQEWVKREGITAMKWGNSKLEKPDDL